MFRNAILKLGFIYFVFHRHGSICLDLDFFHGMQLALRDASHSCDFLARCAGSDELKMLKFLFALSSHALCFVICNLPKCPSLDTSQTQLATYSLTDLSGLKIEISSIAGY